MLGPVLFALATRSKLLPDGGALTDGDFVRLGRLVRTRLEEARRVSRMSRTPAADELWRHLYGVVAKHEPTGLYGAVTARTEAQLLRLSIVYALTDGVAEIDAPHIGAAWAFLCYCDESALVLFKRFTGDRIADTILGALRKLPAGQGMSMTEVHDLFGRHAKAAEINAACELLVAEEAIEKLDTPTGGRPRSTLYLCERSEESEQSTLGQTPLAATSLPPLSSHAHDAKAEAVTHLAGTSASA